MPINATNYRTAHRNAFAGLTERLTLVRRNSNGDIDNTSVREQWIGVVMAGAMETTEGMSESRNTTVTTKIKLFLRPGDPVRLQPKVGDQVRQANGITWEVLGMSGVNSQMFGNYCYEFDAMQSVPDRS